MKIKKELKSTVDIYILIILFTITLLYKSFRDLIEIFSYGIFKNEILTKESKIGFDIKIKIK
tara:strand:- start:5327 stop:5512 length:186 start_codon:yes stop_codon:yes gene_type:complete